MVAELAVTVTSLNEVQLRVVKVSAKVRNYKTEEQHTIPQLELILLMLLLKKRQVIEMGKYKTRELIVHHSNNYRFNIEPEIVRKRLKILVWLILNKIQLRRAREILILKITKVLKSSLSKWVDVFKLKVGKNNRVINKA